MAPKKIGIKGKVLHSQVREIIDRIAKFMEQEAKEGLQIPLKSYRERILAATGISKNTLLKIRKEGREVDLNVATTSFSTPPKNRVRPKRMFTPAEAEEVNSTIYNFYVLEKRSPTIKGILQKMKDRQIDFTGCLSTLSRLIKSLGFRWSKTEDNRKILVEKYDIRMKRIAFRRKMIQYRAEGRNIVYTDETYIHSSHTQPRRWTDASGKELMKPISKGQRLIIVHAGGENGFIPNALLIFKSVILYILCFKTITSNSGTSTLWKLNSDRTKIVEGDTSEALDDYTTGVNTVPQFVTQEDPLFNIITSTERYGSTWIKHDEQGFCTDCANAIETPEKLKPNSTNLDSKILTPKQNTEDDHELSCGKPSNFTFYDNLVGIMNRDKHPPLVEPEAMIEFIRKYKFKAGKTFDLELVENKLKQVKKEKPKSVGTYHQLGNFWRIKGEPGRAIECFRKALAVSPHNADILLNLAKVLFHLQYLDDAIYLTRRSLEVAPPEKGAWQQYFTLGEIFKAYGHYQEAQIHFRHTLDLNPGYEPAMRLLKEMEDMPSSPMHFYTFVIIVCLVVAVLLVILTSLENSSSEHNKSQKQFHKSLKGLSWSNKKFKKINT